MAAIGDINRFDSPGKLASSFGLNPRVRQSGLGAAHHGRISKVGRSHARAMLVEAAWAVAKAPGPLHAFFVRLRARRGHPIAAVALPRKLTVLGWHGLTKDEDYLWGRGQPWSPTRPAPWNCKPATHKMWTTLTPRPHARRRTKAEDADKLIRHRQLLFSELAIRRRQTDPIPAPAMTATISFGSSHSSGIPALRRPSIARSDVSRKRGSPRRLATPASSPFHAEIVLSPLGVRAR